MSRIPLVGAEAARSLGVLGVGYLYYKKCIALNFFVFWRDFVKRLNGRRRLGATDDTKERQKKEGYTTDRKVDS
ncbi:hypothetical protein NDU88_001054 [Pleurodeles waltl]|uniref:Uncharacterized protein n=1 Tax=Pleurodeles waltl TaxID=8319 RepID=A0AAV7KPD2_PLEWA|nr:hypothetical protein NDU88_001054 [Pleurodeles waltl]